MFKPIATQKINDNFYAVRTLFVNAYIYDTDSGLIVFDTGINPPLLMSGFNKLNLDYTKVTHVFLTHSDPDHAGGRKLFKNAKIFISAAEEPLITWKKARRFIIYNRKIKNCNFLADNEEVVINDTTVKTIFTPGHTIGSAIYIINDKILIGGDTISLNFKNEIGHFGIIQNMNHKMNIDTVNKLIDSETFQNKSIIVTGHHGIMNNLY